MTRRRGERIGVVEDAFAVVGVVTVCVFLVGTAASVAILVGQWVRGRNRSVTA